MKNIDSKTIDKLSKCVSNYLKNIEADTYYWNGKMTWMETINFRIEINKQIKKSSYGANQISEVMCWGGIRNFRDNDHLPTAINELQNKKLRHKTYSRISSFSKLFSFYDPQNYFILDARVSLVLNSFFIKIGKSEYVLPFNHRSAQSALARVQLSKLKKIKSSFINIGEAYIEYNHLILKIFKSVNIPKRLPKRPEIIEMALFSMYKQRTK